MAGIERYRSLYGDITKLKDKTLLEDPAGGSAVDNELEQLILAATVWVEAYCNRHFYQLTATKLFDGSGGKQLLVPDLLAVTSLKEDTTDDKTFNDTWAATDYWTFPYNAEPTKHYGRAYTALLVRGSGLRDVFRSSEQNFEIVGQWGYNDLVEDAGNKINDATQTSATATTITYDGGAQIHIGMTVRIGTEDMYVSADTGTVLTVTRGINGTTAATHENNDVISIVRWPAAVERATLITAARLWSRAPAFEPFFVDSDIDTDVRTLLEPYRRIAT